MAKRAVVVVDDDDDDDLRVYWDDVDDAQRDRLRVAVQRRFDLQRWLQWPSVLRDPALSSADHAWLQLWRVGRLLDDDAPASESDTDERAPLHTTTRTYQSFATHERAVRVVSAQNVASVPEHRVRGACCAVM